MDEAALRTDMIEAVEYRLGEPLGASVLSALQRVPREAFVDDAADDQSHAGPAGASFGSANRPAESTNRSRGPGNRRHSSGDATETLPPTTVARMLTALAAEPADSVLIVGAGCGYTAAALAEIVGARHVHAIDIERGAVHRARSNLASAGYDAVLVDRRDGANGLPEYAPYDRILIEAGVIEPPSTLCAQLATDGRLVYPRGTGVQTIVAIARDAASNDDIRSDGQIHADSTSPAASPDSPAPPAGFHVVDSTGPARLDPMLVPGERGGIERNRTRREDAEFATQGYFATHGWEQEWIDWDDR